MQHQQKLKDIEVAQVEELLWKGITSLEALNNEKALAWWREMAEKRRLKNQRLLENSRLDHFMSAFLEEVKIFVNDMQWHRLNGIPL